MTRIPFVGGPLDGETYKWTTARFVLVPDAKDMVTYYDEQRDEMVTLFGRHTYEMKCFGNGGKATYRLEHLKYEKPSRRP